MPCRTLTMRTHNEHTPLHAHGMTNGAHIHREARGSPPMQNWLVRRPRSRRRIGEWVSKRIECIECMASVSDKAAAPPPPPEHDVEEEESVFLHTYTNSALSTEKGRMQETDWEWAFNTLLLVKRKVFDTVVVWYFSLVASLPTSYISRLKHFFPPKNSISKKKFSLVWIIFSFLDKFVFHNALLVKSNQAHFMREIFHEKNHLFWVLCC